MTSNATTADQEASFPGARFDPATMAGSAPLRYVYRDRRIPLAVNVALATGRPLLVTGDPGSGKTTLAADVAARLGWAYVSEAITSRTRIADLVARFDAVQRLSDAQARSVRPEAAYLRPGVLWWAFGSVAQQDPGGATLPEVGDDVRDLRVHPELAGAGVVVLLDEIDKAEPELPNDLLTPLDTLSVEVPGRAGAIRADPSRVLIVITSNGERQMPPAFLRRCLSLEVGYDDPEFLVAVATAHLGPGKGTLYRDVADRTLRLAALAVSDRRRPPSTAEYLDTVRACIRYGQWPAGDGHAASPLWEAVEEAALRKARRAVDDVDGPDGPDRG